MPREIAVAEREGLDARIATGLIDAGALTARHLEPANDLVDAITRALRDAVTADRQLAHFDVRLHVANGSEPGLPMFNHQSTPSTRLHLQLILNEVERVVVGRELMRRVRGQTRAARIALGILDSAGECAIPLFGPAAGLYILEARHWMGLPSSREARREILDMGGELGDAEILTEHEVFQHMPSWTAEHPMPGGTPAERAQALERALTPWRARIDAELARALDRVLEAFARQTHPAWMDPATGEQMDELEDVGPTFCTILSWHADDALPRLFDDWADDAQQMGPIGLIARRSLETGDPAAARTQLIDLRRTIDVAAAVDAALGLLDATHPER